MAAASTAAAAAGGCGETSEADRFRADPLARVLIYVEIVALAMVLVAALRKATR